MAFEHNKSDNVATGNFRKADAFINLSIAAQTESGKAKIGNGVRLMADKNSEGALIDLYNQAAEQGKISEFNEWLKSQLIVDFQLGNTGGAKLAVETPDFLSSNG
jgi:hypothetical protein